MANSSPAVVNEISGRAWIRNSDGSLTELHQGSKVPAGSDIVTASGATVSLQVENGMPIVIGEGREVAVNGDMAGPLADPTEAAVAAPSGTDSDRLLAALQAGRDPFDELDPTAAVVAGGGDAGGSSFVRLARILETTSPLDLAYPNPSRGNDTAPRATSNGLTGDDTDATPTLPDPVRPSVIITVNGDGTVSFNFSTRPVGFDLSDVVVDHGKITNLRPDPTDPTKWIGDLTPETNYEGPVTIKVPDGSYTNEAGTPGLPGETATVVDTLPPKAEISIDTIAGDGVVNAEESGKDIAVTGKVGGDVKVGDTVTLTVNGKDYTGKVVDLGNGSLGYSINVPGSELAKDSNVHASVTTTDDAGNSTTAQTDKGYDVDTSIDASITIDMIAGDGVVNAEESGKDIAVTGKVGGDVKVGDTVTLTVNGQDYTGKVVDLGNGSLGYSINVPGSELAKDSNVHASVTATDDAGNSKTAEADKGYSVDTEIDASITIDTIAGDGVVNAEESGKDIAVTGKVGGDVKVGDTVTLTVNGQDYTGKVVDLGNGSLGYSINVPGSELAKDSNVHASVTATDNAGNSKTAEADKGYSVDTDIDASITIDTIAGDGIVNAEESGKDIAVTGKVGGDVKVGDTVTLTVNGQDYTGKVVDLGNGSLGYSINVPGSELAKDSNVHASVTATDDAGNSKTAEADKGYSVDTDIDATISIDTIAGDGIVNAEESGKDIAVTGKVGGDVKVGDTVTLTVNGQDYTGKVVDLGNGSLGYSINVPGS
ncbi:hypothetical protein CEY09_22765, partial [Achromobacter marplatensis]